jgi:hypothetical protein
VLYPVELQPQCYCGLSRRHLFASSFYSGCLNPCGSYGYLRLLAYRCGAPNRNPRSAGHLAKFGSVFRGTYPAKSAPIFIEGSTLTF